MKPALAATAALGLIGLSFAPAPLPLAPAAAESHSQASCEADGGTYYKEGPDSVCIYPEDKPGNMPNGYDGGALFQETDTGHGHLGNKTESSCDGNKGQCSKLNPD